MAVLPPADLGDGISNRYVEQTAVIAAVSQ
ncbi:hypothetical protein SAMN04489730_0304 [Amycolatopsis australiensis]|uniref:Uncharacterized protein n=1 Tax=Amycolatopsis australiensis TaxID=546364 RepID=A0A1K1P6T8_9PSEU|nr:hypothetical protein SAMN04489730_0304 [Amycolatopsis australiensis]